MCNFYRSFLPNYSEMVWPLTELTKARISNTIKFTDTEKAAFKLVKSELCKTVDLYSPDYTKPFIIRTDASMLGIGCSLSQKGDDDLEYPIAFASCKFSKTELHWPTVVKECYAIVYSLKHFDFYIYLSKIVLYTDNSPLHYIISSIPASSKLMRWVLFLSRYDITIIHLVGTLNFTADCLSRCL